MTRPAPLFSLSLGLILLLLLSCLSLTYGAGDIAPAAAYKAMTAFDGSAEHLLVRTVQVPRTLIAALVGGCLAVAGAVMQALARNPLAAPGLLGVNAGAALAVVCGVFVMGTYSLSAYALFAFLGASAAAAGVYLLGSVGRGGMTPIKITIAGAAVTALLSSLTQVILMLNQRTLDEMRFWLAGSVSGRDLGLFLRMLPYMTAGLVTAVLLGRHLSLLMLGDDVARGLGQRTAWVKALASGTVILLAGSSVAVAGPIGFVGLTVPHVTRALVGTDYRWVLPCAAVLGANLLLVADVGARFVVFPDEVPVGVMTALLGVPFFIYLAGRGGNWK